MNKIPASDEEEDLESLRLAALQSLKRKNQESGLHFPNTEMSPHFRGRGNRNKWGRFGSHQRPGKSGPFNRFRNTNLIPITPIAMETDKTNAPGDLEKPTNLPKNQYSHDQPKEEDCSKFNRYNKSDKSESESEEETEDTDENLGGPLKKSDSLEALMQELDDEIQGKIKSEAEEGDKVQKVKKTKKKPKISEDKDKKDEPQVIEEAKKEVENTKEENKEKMNEEKKETVENMFEHKNITARIPNQRRFIKKQRIHPPRPLPFNPPNHYLPPIPPPYMNPPLFIQTNHNVPHLPPLYFDRPLSPLSINAESLTTATMAPLSPRSAAFVLENKAIIERRKRSPRRSYSRSRSRSLSPRYSLSPPRKFRRSVSPRRLSRSPRRFSPRKRSLSPRRRSLSPSRRPTYNKARPKVEKSEETDKVKEKEDIIVQNQEPLDPILEARKRKFETNEIKKKEGIIRLKPKVEPQKETKNEPSSIEHPKEPDTSNKSIQKPQITKVKDKSLPLKASEQNVEDPLEFQELEKLLNDDPVIEDNEVNHKVVDIFSDEESDSDNEGRFKTKQRQSQKVPTLPFNKLLNGTIQDVKCKELPDSSRPRRERDRRPRYGNPKEPIQPTKKQKITLKNATIDVPEKRTEQKIEMKIKNLVKQEKSEKVKDKIEQLKPKNVCISIDEDDVIIEDIEGDSGSNESCDDENATLREGDLRTQLSRKRAEKMHKLPAEEVSTRILKFALEGAVLKKAKKKSKKKALEKALARREGKLPIHLRLGINNATDIFEDVKVKKKSKKRKNREVLKQV